MPEAMTEVAAASPAIVESLEIPRSGTSDYAEWRISGTLPEPKAASTPAQKEIQVDKGEATAPDKQEPIKPKTKTAEERIADLERRQKQDADTIEKIRKGANLETRKAEPSPASETKPVQQQFTRSKPTAEGKGIDGKPYATYEDYIEDLSDWKAEQREVANEQRKAIQQQNDSLKAEIEKARSRYDNLDEVMFPALKEITAGNVSPVVTAMLNESDVLPDLLYTIGSSPEDLAAFVKMGKENPGKAIRYLAVTENLIREELDKQTTREVPQKGADGKFVKTEPVAPVKRGSDSTPEPPLELGARSANTMDEATRALSAIERGDTKATRAWLDAENAKDLRRRRGV